MWLCENGWIVKCSRCGLPPEFNDSKIVESAVGEVILVAKKYLSKPQKNIKVLDVGSGHGEYARTMAKHFGTVVGVEPFREGYEVSVKNRPKGNKNLSYVHTKIEDYKTTLKFDLIVHLTVFEHMNDPRTGFDNIFSMLEPNGIIFLTAPNKYWVFEQHYGLPFLAWLPLPLANFYLRTVKGVDSYEDSSYSRGYGGMKAFFDQYDCRYEFVLPQDVNGAYVGCGKNQSLFSFIKVFGIRLIKFNPFFWNFSKGFMMVIRKNN